MHWHCLGPHEAVAPALSHEYLHWPETIRLDPSARSVKDGSGSAPVIGRHWTLPLLRLASAGVAAVAMQAPASNLWPASQRSVQRPATQSPEPCASEGQSSPFESADVTVQRRTVQAHRLLAQRQLSARREPHVRAGTPRKSRSGADQREGEDTDGEGPHD